MSTTALRIERLKKVLSSLKKEAEFNAREAVEMLDRDEIMHATRAVQDQCDALKAVLHVAYVLKVLEDELEDGVVYLVTDSEHLFINAMKTVETNE